MVGTIFVSRFVLIFFGFFQVPFEYSTVPFVGEQMLNFLVCFGSGTGNDFDQSDLAIIANSATVLFLELLHKRIEKINHKTSVSFESTVLRVRKGSFCER